jgi:hypothetical protein
VQLARQASPFDFLACDDAPQSVACDAAREVDGDGRPHCELLCEAKLGAAEALIAANLVVRDQHADRPLAREQRHVEAGRRPQPPGDVLVDLGVLHERVDPFAAPAFEHSPGLRLMGEKADRREIVGAFAVGGRNAKPISGGECDGDEPGADELSQASSDQVEQRLELQLADERCPHLVERFELPRPCRRRLVEPRVLDRDCSLRRQQLYEVLVILVEIGAGFLLRQVQVAVGDAPEQDRNAQEGVHRRMAGWEAGGAGVLIDPGQPDRSRIVDQRPEQALALRQLADLGHCLIRDADMYELGQMPVWRDHTQRGIPRVQ